MGVAVVVVVAAAAAAVVSIMVVAWSFITKCDDFCFTLV